VDHVSDNELDVSEDEVEDVKGECGPLLKPQYEVKDTSKEEKDYWLLRLATVMRQLVRQLKLGPERMPKIINPFSNPDR
jgi:hypothetical protein